MLSATKQATIITFATTVVHFVRDFDFANVYIRLDQLVLLSVFSANKTGR